MHQALSFEACEYNSLGVQFSSRLNLVNYSKLNLNYTPRAHLNSLKFATCSIASIFKRQVLEMKKNYSVKHIAYQYRSLFYAEYDSNSS